MLYQKEKLFSARYQLIRTLNANLHYLSKEKEIYITRRVQSKEESWCRYNPHSHKHSLLTHHFLLCTQPHPCYTQLFPASYHYQTAVNHCNSRRLISYTRERERERERESAHLIDRSPCRAHQQFIGVCFPLSNKYQIVNESQSE